MMRVLGKSIVRGYVIMANQTVFNADRFLMSVLSNLMQRMDKAETTPGGNLTTLAILVVILILAVLYIVKYIIRRRKEHVSTQHDTR